MIIDCISDLHGYYPKLDSGDLLIVAGDLTARDTPKEHLQFVKWLKSQSYKMKIFIGGNHDNAVEKYAVVGTSGDHCYYLCDSGTEFEGLKIWGCPWSKRFKGMNPKCMAFTIETEHEMDEILYKMPYDVDILITHEAPYGILDEVAREDQFIEGHQCDKIEHVGSHALKYHSLMNQPLLHVFGHIHEGHGIEKEEYTTTYINASYVNERYQPVNKPIRIFL